MRILYIDTSSSYLYTGVVEENKILCEVKKEFGHSLSEEALPELVSMLEENKIEAASINKMIVVDGPGSFTGIRIGITIAKVYAWSLHIPITTITSLEAMSLSSQERNFHVPIIDARRNYVFSAIYDEDYRQIMAPQHIKIVDLIPKVEALKDYIVITNDEVEFLGKRENYIPDILKIVNYFKEKPEVNPHSVNPEYLKLTEAEESKLA